MWNKSKTMKVTKKSTFEAAHTIKGHITCGNMHGHSYKLEVTLEGPVIEGMVMDFKELKSLVKERVIDKLDHEYLDELGYFKISTAENISVWIWNQIYSGLAGNVHLSEIKLYETADSFATYNGK